ncbi:cytochrome P450 [Methylobacterium iners]|uniref:Pentalenene oxygenase n=1 Tax=Methylobacterium iners TaxID=418707 RepID=A0ABQ4S5N1_9HYPH|nr:cytochrome P450 [Methylobacterium iners]GJD97702.1 Pentalenene oxygenase [Methylobacterium iners]
MSTTHSQGAAILVPPVPEPPADDLGFFQTLKGLRNDATQIWSKRTYSELITRRRFLGRTTFVLNDPDAIRRVLVDNPENYERTKPTIRMLRPTLGDGLFISEGQAWRQQRRALAPAFTPKAIEALLPHIHSAIDEAIDELKKQARRGPVDLFTTVQHLALEIAGRTMFSVGMQHHGSRLREMVVEYGKTLGRPHLLDFLIPLRWPTPHDLLRARFRRRWNAFLDEVIASRHAERASRPAGDLLDLLAAVRDPDTGIGFTPDELRDQVATMILAGHETTAVALFWAIYLLALAPEVQEKVAEEASRTANLANLGTTAELTYTRAVVDETLRLYPPAFVIVRQARGADRVGKHAVAPGDIMAIAPWVLHRHQGLWRNPNAFDPRRFLPKAEPVARYAYLPFGVGPRICIGAHFALIEATHALAKLAGAFRITLADDRPVFPAAVITTQPDHPAAFHLLSR